MSGILDSKTRLIDTILTLEGRRQLAQGGLDVRFVSFTDAESFYEVDVASGSTDAGDRLSLEACSLPQDQVTFRSSIDGKLSSYPGSALGVLDGKVLTGSGLSIGIVTGSAFMQSAGSLLASSIDNFSNLYVIRTRDAIFDDDTEFSISSDAVSFSVTPLRPFGKGEVTQASVDRVESVFQDKRFSRSPNFMYLPPINRAIPGSNVSSSLGQYPVLGQRTTPLTYDALLQDMAGKEQAVVQFSQTTLRSNIICQMFELRQDLMRKLDVVDFGEVLTGDTQFPSKHVFFVGRLFIDGNGSETFVSIFTLMFE